MKNTFVFLLAALSLCAVRTSRATISIAATPSTQTVSLGGTFTISLSLTVTQSSAPANVTGFDLYLATSSANSGYFTVKAAAATGPFTSSGPASPESDPLSTAAAAGFVRNGLDQGFSGATVNTPTTSLALETLTLSVGANVPKGTYTFLTTSASNAGVYYSDISDSGFNTYPVDTAGTFSITVVPEPSTWALGLLGGAVGLIAVRRRTRRTV